MNFFRIFNFFRIKYADEKKCINHVIRKQLRMSIIVERVGFKQL